MQEMQCPDDEVGAPGSATSKRLLQQVPSHGRMPHEGFSWSPRDAWVKTVSPGRRLTRPAPPRMALSCEFEIPLLLLLMLPASLIESASLNFLGGAKSRPVNVDDLRIE